MSREALPAPVAEVVHRELNGQTVLVNLRTNRIFALNASGSRFWTLLVEGRNRTEIRAQLLDEFDVASDVLDAEIDALVSNLRAAALVE